MVATSLSKINHILLTIKANKTKGGKLYLKKQKTKNFARRHSRHAYKKNKQEQKCNQDKILQN